MILLCNFASSAIHTGKFTGYVDVNEIMLFSDEDMH